MTRLNLTFKLFFFLKVFAVYLIICLKSYGDDYKINKDIITVGPDDAIVKIKIFSSLTCPHCANFHINVVPKIKEKYIETGNVQLIFIVEWIH